MIIDIGAITLFMTDYSGYCKIIPKPFTHKK